MLHSGSKWKYWLNRGGCTNFFGIAWMIMGVLSGAASPASPASAAASVPSSEIISEIPSWWYGLYAEWFIFYSWVRMVLTLSSWIELYEGGLTTRLSDMAMARRKRRAINDWTFIEIIFGNNKKKWFSAVLTSFFLGKNPGYKASSKFIIIFKYGKNALFDSFYIWSSLALIFGGRLLIDKTFLSLGFSSSQRAMSL